MANAFDQFDRTESAANPFDQFDDPVKTEAAGAITPPSLTDTVMSGPSTMETAAYLPRGMRRGLANIAGLPVDAVNAGMGLVGLPSSEKPFLGSKSIDEILGLPAAAGNALVNAASGETPPGGLSSELPPPSTLAQRVLSRTGEEIGAAAVPVGAAVRAGSMGVEAARKLPLLARMFVEPAAIAPGAFAGKEAATALAAGIGASGANEATRASGANPDGVVHKAADIAGALFGAGSLGAARVVGGPVKDLSQLLTKGGRDNFSNKLVGESVTDTLANSASGLPKKAGEPIDTQPLVDAINRGTRIDNTVPGFRESTADRTADPGLAALEYGRQSGPNSGLFTGRRGENTNAIDSAINKFEPDGTPGALRDELAVERTRRLTDANVHTQNANDALSQHLQRLQPAMTGEGRGADIRTALEGASTGAREVVDAAWAPLNNSGQHVDMAPLANDFERVGQNLSTAERDRFQPREATIPGRLSGEQPVVPERLGADGQPVTETITQPINEVTGLRSALSDAAREARTAGRVNEARIVDQHIEALDSYLNRTVPPDLRQEYDAARAATVNFNDRFTRPQTAIAQTLDRQQGQYRQPDSAVAGKFVQADEGRVADFEALMREAGNDTRVQGAVRDQVLADVRDRGLLENPQGLTDYLGRYGTVFRRFPDLQRELGTAGALRTTLDTATGSEAGLARSLGTADRAGTSTVGKYLQYGDERAADAMKGVLANKNPGAATDDLLGFVNDAPKAVEGARKAFWDIMQSKARSAGETTKTMDGTQPWMPRALKGFLDNPATSAVAERLYRDNPEHLKSIREIADALQGVDVRSRAKAVNSSGTAQGVSNVLTPETVQSRFYAYKRGQTSLGFMVTALASVAARRAVRGSQADAIEKLLDKSLLDPDLAAQLLKDNNPANRAALARTAKTYLGNEASTVVNMIGDDKKDPTTDAIMRGDANAK